MNIPSKFIVVDDDPFNNFICKHIITNFEPTAHIQLFTDPEEALKWIQKTYSHETDDLETILFLDINMPEISGWEFLDEFSLFSARLHAQFKIFILSSSIDPEDKAKAEKHPMIHGFYSKPLSQQTLDSIFKEE
jgi:CheY-like chemotaxis protein